MKKFMISCLVAACCMFLIGILMFIPACSKGTETINDVLEGVTDIAQNVDGLDELGDKISSGVQDLVNNAGNGGTFSIEADDISVQFDSNYTIYENVDSIDKTLIDGQATKITAEIGGCALKLETSDDGQIYMEAKNVEKMQTYVKDGTLVIKAKKTKISNISDTQGTKITVYLPKDQVMEMLDLDLGAGALDINCALKANQVKLDVGAGAFNATELNADNLNISVGMGAVKLSNMEVGKLEAKVGMGAFSFNGVLNGDADLECAMGSIDGKIKGDEKSYNYKVDGAMGEVKVGSTGAKGLAKEWSQDNGANRTITVECSMGSAKISFE